MALGDRIGIADKLTLDKTKKNTDDIVQSTNFIKEQFPLNISGGTDWSLYKPIINKTIIPTAQLKNTYSSVFEITGGGYISCLVVEHQWLNANKMSAEIIVDGNVIYEGSINGSYGSTECAGFATTDFYLTMINRYLDSSSDKVGMYRLYDSSLPVTSKNVGDVTVLTVPLFFKMSLKVNLKFINSPQVAPLIFFVGGVK